MSASQINDLINPARLRLGIKRAFTGDVNEILSEMFGNSQRAGARNAQITTDNLNRICFPAPGMSIGVMCSRALTDQLVRALTDGWHAYRSPARGYHDLLNVTINDTAVNTSVQEDAMPSILLIETSYQNNKLVIGLYGKEGYATQHGIWVNFFGQMIPADHYSRFQAYLEVRHGRPVNPMSPSRRGVIKDEALNRLCDFIRDSLFDYFSQTPVDEIDPLALEQFYHDYPAQASKLPCFVAARRRRYESGDDASKMTSLSAPQVLSYENPPLLLADKARVVREDRTVDSVEYGLHTFLELTGAAYKVMDADDSRLDVRRLWWKPGEQIQLASGCPQIFHKAGQWGLGTEQEPPAEWREINNHVVFAFNDPNNWDVDNVDFTVGGADPQDFYQTDAWGGFDPSNDQGRSGEEMSESYRESCEREIRNLIGNAVPKNFSWDDLLRFVPEGEQIIAVTPEYRSRRKHRPASVILLLSNDEIVRLSLF